MLLENGMVKAVGDTDYIVEEYLKTTQNIQSEQYFEGDNAPGNRDIKLRHIAIINQEGHPIATAYIDKMVGVHIEYEVLRECEAFNPAIHVTNDMGVDLFQTHNTHKMSRANVQPGHYQTTMWIPANTMQNGEAIFGFTCFHYTPDYPLFKKVDVAKIEYLDSLTSITRNEDYRGNTLPGVMRPAVQWDECERM
jgi:hypothetical protein